MQLATSFMATRYLIAAAEVGVFEALGDAALDLDALAARIAVPRRTARICADAMVALRLLERDGPLYRNSPAAGAFLSGRGPRDLRPFVRLMDRRYPAWAEFTEAIRAGQGPGFITRLDAETQRVYSAGVESVTAGSARGLAQSYEFGRHRRLLDLDRLLAAAGVVLGALSGPTRSGGTRGAAAVQGGRRAGHRVGGRPGVPVRLHPLRLSACDPRS